MTTRRKALKTLALSSALAGSPLAFAQAKEKAPSQFKFSLNTSTIRGQKLSLSQMIEVAARAGYDGIELWIMELNQYLESGKSLSNLKQELRDAGIEAINAIGFATWMAQDPAKSKQGFEQIEVEMNQLAEIGCVRVAAPAIGAEAPVDLFEAGEKYARLLELGRKTGCMPQLEFWGAFPPFHQLGQALAVAAMANDADARLLPDIYHLFRGGSGFEGLKLINGNAIEVFHLNDFADTLPREQQEDKHRIYPGDGVAPIGEVVETLTTMGGEKYLSLELFNPSLYRMDADVVAQTGLAKMKQFF
ncbi:sugar phosphate isomerase/epimerase family protein [Algoriphagus vanfongensis]|uniref:sugar phosphate isomerase/epimerase family protein n=1 Tax=Algoriphagus vanfongensis TaxID=426371 RepID=UPI0003FB0F9A|nr:sugar phosphate isomerase/epimerase [Algoriphagus vanfongensis]